jgi:hypothetical protein
MLLPFRPSPVSVVINSVSDLYSFFTDPDPDVDAGDQYGSGSRALMTKNYIKKLELKKKINLFFIKNCNLPIARPP